MFNMAEYKINAKEYSLSCHDLTFLCVLGQHINGGFCAIVNWGVAVELASDNNVQYNREKLLSALERSPSSSWLPTDQEARAALARDLAMMIGERIAALPQIDLPI